MLIDPFDWFREEKRQRSRRGVSSSNHSFEKSNNSDVNIDTNDHLSDLDAKDRYNYGIFHDRLMNHRELESDMEFCDFQGFLIKPLLPQLNVSLRFEVQRIKDLRTAVVMFDSHGTMTSTNVPTWIINPESTGHYLVFPSEVTNELPKLINEILDDKKIK